MYERQALLIPDAMKQASALVVGCGMLGSWTIHSLIRTMRSVIAYDMDTVGLENIGTQAYSYSDETMNKAQAMSMHLQGFGYIAVPERFEDGPDMATFEVVVSAVDSFDARRLVADFALQSGAKYFIDTRAHGTVGVVVFVEAKDIPAYLATLESDETAPEPLCGAEGTGFNGMWVAQYLTGALARGFGGLPVNYKVVHDAGMDARILTEATAPQLEGAAQS